MTINPARAQARFQATSAIVKDVKQAITNHKGAYTKQQNLAAELTTKLESLPETDDTRPSVAREIEAAILGFQEEQVKIESLSLQLTDLLVKEAQQEGAYKRMVREYPTALARHLRHMRHSHMVDSKGRTKKTVLEARKAAEAIGEGPALDAKLAEALNG